MNTDYNYEYGHDTYYCYPNSNVLKNKLNIIDAEELKRAEREITALRTAQALVDRIDGNFDYNHLKKIHHFLFSDIYEWAGMTRCVNITKGNCFCLCEYIDVQMNALFKKLHQERYLKNYKLKEEIAKRLAYYLGEINAIHPFREGNGRAQRMFIEHLSYSLGYNFDFMKVTSEEMLMACVKSFQKDYIMLELLISKALNKI